jgi:hypothetical protein
MDFNLDLSSTFSPFDVVGHLIDGEETDWIPRAQTILARGPHLRFEPYDRFRHRARNVSRSLGSLLQEFASCRRQISSSCATGGSRRRICCGRERASLPNERKSSKTNSEL